MFLKHKSIVKFKTIQGISSTRRYLSHSFPYLANDTSLFPVPFFVNNAQVIYN